MISSALGGKKAEMDQGIACYLQNEDSLSISSIENMPSISISRTENLCVGDTL